MKRPLISALLISALATVASAQVLADHKSKHHHKRYDQKQHTDFAKVTQVEPIYKTISHRIPERSCWTETRYVPVSQGNKSYTPTIIGTLIGGAIGNEVGHNKSNKRVGAVVGAALGASLANDWSRANNRHHSGQTRAVNEEVCEVNERVEYEEKLVGYDVTYRYHGQHYTTRMNHHPGERIKVAVNVRPVSW